jgi:hypothetical protein
MEKLHGGGSHYEVRNIDNGVDSLLFADCLNIYLAMGYLSHLHDRLRAQLSSFQVCVRRPAVDLVVTLISCNRNACMLPDHNGRLPLHLACCHGASLKVIQTLLMEYP